LSSDGVLLNAVRYSTWKEFGLKMVHHAKGAIYYNIKPEVSFDIKSFKPQNSKLIHNNAINTNSSTRYITDNDFKAFDKIKNRLSCGISEKFILDWFEAEQCEREEFLNLIQPEAVDAELANYFWAFKYAKCQNSVVSDIKGKIN
jgi:hypothetical protein